jgi:hypothetical protein
MKNSLPLSKMEIAVSLVDRENVMHYPLSLLTKECDKVTVWAFLRGKPPFSLEVCSKGTKPLSRRPKGLALNATSLGKEELEKFFQIASSADAKARNLLNDNKLTSSLVRAREFLEYLLIDEGESRIFMTGRLTEKSLDPLLDIVMLSGRSIIGFSSQK